MTLFKPIVVALMFLIGSLLLYGKLQSQEQETDPRLAQQKKLRNEMHRRASRERKPIMAVWIRPEGAGWDELCSMAVIDGLDDMDLEKLKARPDQIVVQEGQVVVMIDKRVEPLRSMLQTRSLLEAFGGAGKVRTYGSLPKDAQLAVRAHIHDPRQEDPAATAPELADNVKLRIMPKYAVTLRLKEINISLSADALDPQDQDLIDGPLTFKAESGKEPVWEKATEFDSMVIQTGRDLQPDVRTRLAMTATQSLQDVVIGIRTQANRLWAQAVDDARKGYDEGWLNAPTTLTSLDELDAEFRSDLKQQFESVLSIYELQEHRGTAWNDAKLVSGGFSFVLGFYQGVVDGTPRYGQSPLRSPR